MGIRWVREDHPIANPELLASDNGTGLHLVALPGQRYVQAEDGQWYGEWAVIEDMPIFPVYERLERRPSSLPPPLDWSAI